MASPFALFAPHKSDPVRAREAVQTTAGGWRLSAPDAVLWALAVAVLMSTQYLVQPFVWKYWPVDEVLLGWLDVVRNRVLVALAIAGALVLATRVPVRNLHLRALLIATAVVAGVVAGEASLLTFGETGERADASSVIGSIVRWTGVALCVAAIYVLWARYHATRAASLASELRRSTTEALLVQTQLQSLRHQIDPHFLFNTLATIQVLRETDATGGTRLLRHLLDYLRWTMPNTRQRTTLGEEAGLAASYLAVVAARMTGRLDVTFDIPDSLRRHPCPPLTLATLVENAVKHGITPSPNGGAIVVRARRDGGVLEVVVADTGVGVESNGSANPGGSGIGLANVRARLRAMHGDRASLAILGNDPHGVCAVIRVPFELVEAQ